MSIRLYYDVIEGSVVGPLLYLLYTAELFEVISHCGSGAHCYTDDSQVSISNPASGVSAAVDRFGSCIEQIEMCEGKPFKSER